MKNIALRRRLGIYPIRYGNSVQLLQSGEVFFSQLEKLIKEARHLIHFQIYIFEPDTSGKIIADLLTEAAMRGVKIHMVLDGYGSQNFPESWKRKFKESGIQLFFYSPFKLGKYLHMGMRLHHKIMIFDEKTALIGGINISNPYSAYTHKTPWLDFALTVQGKVIQDLLQICNSTLHTVNSRNKHRSKLSVQSSNIGHLPVHIRVLQNNWLQARFGISKRYRQQIRKSENQIIILASYFVPSIALKRLLKNASQRGVKVWIVLGAISDVGIVKHATQYFYEDMLKAGIQLFEWRPSVLHAKVALIDKQWMSIGSYNLNHLSDFGSIECNLEIHDEAFCSQTEIFLKDLILKDCDNISWIQYHKRYGYFQKVYNALCYWLVRLSLNLLFFLQNRNNKKELLAVK